MVNIARSVPLSETNTFEGFLSYVKCCDLLETPLTKAPYIRPLPPLECFLTASRVSRPKC